MRRSPPGSWTRSSCSLAPILVGGGKAALPDDVRVQLELLEERRFAGGVVFLRYAVTG